MVLMGLRFIDELVFHLPFSRILPALCHSLLVVLPNEPFLNKSKIQNYPKATQETIVASESNQRFQEEANSSHADNLVRR